MYWLKLLRAWRRNRRFQRLNPDFPVPPRHLAFDALNDFNWGTYRESGIRHASVFCRIIRQYLDGTSLNVLEWGCGPGRLIRHLSALLSGRELTLTGADYNIESINWCRENLRGIEFAENQLLPPLPFPDDRFDVVYSFSVFTHLSENVQVAWAKELFRVLKPGGLIICTTHGDKYRYLLASQRERRQFGEGRVVVQGGYREGKKWFFAVHPAPFVRDVLLKSFSDVQRIETIEADDLLQDVWTGWKGKAPGT